MCAEIVHARFRREGDLKHANAVTTHVSSSPALGSALLSKRPNQSNQVNVGDPDSSSRREVLADKCNSEGAEMAIRKSDGP